MEDSVLVSVIMPTYNCEKFIGESIESVIAQSEKNWEIRIIDDCSTDNTEKIVKKYIEKYPQKIFYFRLQENGGPAVARTEAIRMARGKYIAFLDGDDVWLPQKLEKQIAFMESRGAVFSATAYEHMDENGNDLHYICYPPEKIDYKNMLRLGNPIGNTTVMYNQEVLGKYEVPQIKKRNDFALWLKILKDCDYCYGMQEVMARYRVRANSVSNNKFALAKYHWQLYRKIERLNVVKSIYYLLCWAFVKSTGIGLKRKKF